MAVTADRYVNEYFAAPSPDGKAVAFTARGIAFGQWWRHGPQPHRRGGDLALAGRHGGRDPSYERVTEGGAKEVWPMWAGDGRTLFYVSDRSGAPEHLGAAARQAAASAHALHRRARAVAVGVWRRPHDRLRARLRDLDARHRLGQDRGDPASTRRGAPAGPAVEHLGSATQIQELALSPDGKKVAFVVHGEVFAASAKDGGDAARVTRTAGNEAQVAWAPDGRRAGVRVGPRRRDSPLPLRFHHGSRNAGSRRARATTHGRSSRPTASAWRSCEASEELRVLDDRSARNASSPRDISPTGWRAAVRWRGRPTGSGWPCSPSAPRDFVNVAHVVPARRRRR